MDVTRTKLGPPPFLVCVDVLLTVYSFPWFSRRKVRYSLDQLCRQDVHAFVLLSFGGGFHGD